MGDLERVEWRTPDHVARTGNIGKQLQPLTLQAEKSASQLQEQPELHTECVWQGGLTAQVLSPQAWERLQRMAG